MEHTFWLDSRGGNDRQVPAGSWESSCLRVSTLYADTSASTAAYYTRYLTQADGEQPGHWTGRQAGV